MGVVVSRPVQMDSAEMTYRLPVTRTRDGRVVQAQRQIDLAPATRETDFGLFYRRMSGGGRLSVESFAEYRRNAPMRWAADLSRPAFAFGSGCNDATCYLVITN